MAYLDQKSKVECAAHSPKRCAVFGGRGLVEVEIFTLLGLAGLEPLTAGPVLKGELQLSSAMGAWV